MRTIKINFSDFWSKSLDRVFFYNILKEHFKLEISNDPEFLIYSVYTHDHLNYKCKKIFYTAENVLPDYRFCDYSIGFNYEPENKYHLRYPLYLFYRDIHDLVRKGHVSSDDIMHKANFCSFVVSNAHAKERTAFFKQLDSIKHVDSAGKVLNNMPDNWSVPKDDDAKIEFLKTYRFNIAFENSASPGYTTEKIMEPMRSYTIPIYWGDPLVHLDFDPASFIHVKADADMNKVIDYIMELENNPLLYLEKINTPVLYNNIVPEHLKEERLLEFFENIFYKDTKQPVSQTAAFGFNKTKLKAKKLFDKASHKIKKITR